MAHGSTTGAPSSEVIFAALEKEMTQKQTTGGAVVQQMQVVEKIIAAQGGLELKSIVLQPDHVSRILQEHFMSPLACHQHTRAVISALKRAKENRVHRNKVSQLI